MFSAPLLSTIQHLATDTEGISRWSLAISSLPRRTLGN
jgi:hypothetical protein